MIGTNLVVFQIGIGVGNVSSIPNKAAYKTILRIDLENREKKLFIV